MLIGALNALLIIPQFVSNAETLIKCTMVSVKKLAESDFSMMKLNPTVSLVSKTVVNVLRELHVLIVPILTKEISTSNVF